MEKVGVYAAVTPNNMDVVVLVLFSGTCAETFTKKEQERRGVRETARGLEKSCKCVRVWRVLSTVGVSLVPCGTLPSSLRDRQLIQRPFLLVEGAELHIQSKPCHQDTSAGVPHGPPWLS